MSGRWKTENQILRVYWLLKERHILKSEKKKKTPQKQMTTKQKEPQQKQPLIKQTNKTKNPKQ